MHCPVCGQQQANDHVRFCSRCGFLLTGIAEVVANGGVIPQMAVVDASGKQKDSPKKRGVKQGALLFLSGILIVPIIGIITAALNADGYVAGAAAIICFVGGLLRMIYAALFEEGAPSRRLGEGISTQFAHQQIAAQQQQNALPPQQSIPVADYVQPGRWRDTNDLAKQPSSVTESTTKLLERDTE